MAALLMCTRNVIKCRNLLRVLFINDYLIIRSHVATEISFSFAARFHSKCRGCIITARYSSFHCVGVRYVCGIRFSLGHIFFRLYVCYQFIPKASCATLFMLESIKLITVEPQHASCAGQSLCGQTRVRKKIIGDDLLSFFARCSLPRQPSHITGLHFETPFSWMLLNNEF